MLYVIDVMFITFHDFLLAYLKCNCQVFQFFMHYEGLELTTCEKRMKSNEAKKKKKLILL